jgi:hypothetical protein
MPSVTHAHRRQVFVSYLHNVATLFHIFNGKPLGGAAGMDRLTWAQVGEDEGHLEFRLTLPLLYRYFSATGKRTCGIASGAI